MRKISPWLACAAAIVLTTGCSESPESGRKLIPVETANGLITYRYEDEVPVAKTPPSSKAWLPTPQDDPIQQQRRQDERYDRDMAQWRRDRDEQRRREDRELQAYQDATRNNLRQARADQDWQEYQYREANRRRAEDREAQLRYQAESRAQQEAAATASYLEFERRQIQHQAYHPHR